MKMPEEVKAYLDSLSDYKRLDAGTKRRRPKPSPHVVDYLNALSIKKKLYEIACCKDRNVKEYDVSTYIEEIRWLLEQTHRDKDRQVIVVSKWDTAFWGEWISQQAFTISELSDYKLFRLLRHGQKTNLYCTVNTFSSSYHRTSNFAYSVDAFVIDIDYYKDTELSTESTEKVYGQIIEVLEPLGLTPSFAVSSGRGLYVYFLLSDSLMMFNNKNKALYTAIMKKLVSILKDYGADPFATDVSRVLRLPSTKHQKSGSIAYIIDFDKVKDDPIKYTIDEIIEKIGGVTILPPPPPPTVSKPKRTQKSDKPKPQKTNCTHAERFTKDSMARARVQDLEKLAAYRSFNLCGMRSYFFLIYFSAALMYMDEDAAYSKAKAIFNKLAAPPSSKSKDTFTVTNLNDAYASALKSHRKRQINQDGYYSFSNEYIIKHLEITDAEQQELSSIISYTEKLSRNASSRRIRRRNVEGLTNRQQAAEHNRKRVRSLLDENKTVSEITALTGLKKSMIYEVKKSSAQMDAL